MSVLTSVVSKVRADAVPDGTGLVPGRSILIVEDETDNRETLAEILEYEGYAVHAAENGREALDLLRGGVRPFIILLDLMMPVMDGWEFRDHQRSDPLFAGIPVVVMSGDGRVAQKAESVGAAGYVPKPIDIDILLETVQQYC